jgi:hypothetical protein
MDGASEVHGGVKAFLHLLARAVAGLVGGWAEPVPRGARDRRRPCTAAAPPFFWVLNSDATCADLFVRLRMETRLEYRTWS